MIDLARGDDRHHGHAAAFGEQRDERLVLHLLEPAGADALGTTGQIADQVAAMS